MAYFYRIRPLLGKLSVHPLRAAVCVALAASDGSECARERRIEEVYDLFDNRPIGMVRCFCL